MDAFSHSKFRFHNCERYMDVSLFIDSTDEELLKRYRDAAHAHNTKMMTEQFIDSGFDLYTPQKYECLSGTVSRINSQVKCAAKMVYESGKEFPTGYYLYPRSSISKTSMRLANSVGIIDSGYRGDLIGAFDCLKNGDVLQYEKLVQICSPGLEPVYITLVSSEAELGTQTSRGSGGFGSTGRF
jgi:dUTP pyrophosphatase